jgi:hypothetical protein
MTHSIMTHTTERAAMARSATGRRTFLKDPRKEIGPGLLREMRADLGLSPRDLAE